MVEDAVLQILQLLAYLAIGLISVTFPVYAICVTYLRQEKGEAEKDREKRVGKRKEQIEKITKELTGKKKGREYVERMEEQIRTLKAELRRDEERVGYITAKGAVRDPVLILTLSLAIAVMGIVILYSLQTLLTDVLAILAGIGSAGSLGVAGYLLYKTICTIEYAALRPARTIGFNVTYRSRQKSRQVKLGEKTELNIGACPEEGVERFQVSIFVHPDIEVVDALGAQVVLQPEGFAYGGYNMIYAQIDFIREDVYHSLSVTILPKKSGHYLIPIELYGKGIYKCKTELFLNVVEKAETSKSA